MFRDPFLRVLSEGLQELVRLLGAARWSCGHASLVSFGAAIRAAL